MGRAGILVAICLLVGMVGPSPVVAIQAAPVLPSRGGHESRAFEDKSSTFDPAQVVAADGRFVGATGLVGTIDTGGLTLVSDLASGEPPVLGSSAQTVNPLRSTPDSLTAAALGATVYALAVSGNNLYVGGEFRNVAGIPEADYVARWDGTTWSALGSNGAGNGALDAGVRAIAIHGSNVVVGGFFTDVAGIAGADFVARWTGSSWAPLQNMCCGAAAINNSVHALVAHGDFVYAGGYFTDAGGYTGVSYLARYSVPCDCWSSVGPVGSMTGPVFAIAIGRTRIYVGGFFNDAGGKQYADNVAFFSTSEWWSLGSGVNWPVFCMVLFEPDEYSEHVYVGGAFTNVGGAAGDYLARFDSIDWYSRRIERRRRRSAEQLGLCPEPGQRHAVRRRHLPGRGRKSERRLRRALEWKRLVSPRRDLISAQLARVCVCAG